MHKTAQLLTEWYNKLQKCADLDLAIQCFARAIGACSEATATVIFLLDQEKKQLKATACWSNFDSALDSALNSGQKTKFNAQQLEHLAVEVEKLDDPLAFVLYSGKKCVISESLSLNDSIFQLINELCQGYFGQAIILPLLAPNQQTLGVVLIAHNQDSLQNLPAMSDEAELAINLLCDYGAAVLNTCIQSLKINSFVNTLQEDFKRLQDEQKGRENPENNWDILGESKEIKTVLKLIKKTALSQSTVLITGETGTGKELVAAAIHKTSKRAGKPFLKINCTAMPENLFESELFGYVKGAFTSANKNSLGLLRSADEGTLLLDEIGDMSLSLQTKLLRFLQDRLVRPVGDVNSYPVNIRIIASTNCDLEKAIKAGSFRRDLYHRLAVFTISLPALRNRIKDISLLAEHFTKHFASQYQRYRLKLAPESLQLLYSYDYFGNVRELGALIERAVLMTDAQTELLEPAHFKQQRQDIASLPELLANYEAEIISKTFDKCAGNISQASEIMGIPRRTLAYKLQKISLSNKSSEIDRSNPLEQF